MPIIQKLVDVYELLHEYLGNFPRTVKYTLGAKIDNLFIEIIENVFIASYLPYQEKTPFLSKTINKLDLIKFFLQISWKNKYLDNKKYIILSEKLNEIGKILGGWKKGLENKTLIRR